MSFVRLGLAALLVALSALACGDEETAPPAAPAAGADAGADTGAAEADEPIADAPAPETADQSTQAKTDLGGATQSKGQTGRLLYRYVPPKNAQLTPYVNGVVKTKTLIDAINLFNGVLTFPTDVPVVAKECGRINAFYDPRAHSVSLCYEMMHALHQAFAMKLSDKTDAERMAITAKAWAFVSLHEAGHAFLGENKIGVLGGEEDVVDDISGLFFVASGQPDIPIYGTGALVALQPTSATFSDEHSFTKQRYFNMICLVYGSDPAKYGSLVGPEAEMKLPQDRAVRCPGEWTNKKSALGQLIGPYVRK